MLLNLDHVIYDPQIIDKISVNYKQNVVERAVLQL